MENKSKNTKNFNFSFGEPPKGNKNAVDISLDWSNVFGESDSFERVSSPADGLIKSLTERGEVDIGYISMITGMECRAVVEALKGSIYQDPRAWDEDLYKGWLTADEYLSGELIPKLLDAREATKKYRGLFDDNVRAIESVLPKRLPADDIYVTLGSPWIPAHIIEDFLKHILHLRETKLISRVLRDDVTGTWQITAKNLYSDNVRSYMVYGTRRMSALHIIENTLNLKNVAVYDEVDSPSSPDGKKKVENEQETIAALEKQRKIKSEFQSWVFADKRRKETLESIYQARYGCIRRRVFDGSFLTFPGMSPDVKLYNYQKDAVARILFTPNTLLAHDVGAGKTYVMIAAGMELRRMGLSKKNLYVVPNNLVGQWKTIFKTMYPKAKVLTVEGKDFTPAKRMSVLRSIACDDFDGVIMTYTCFQNIPLSTKCRLAAVDDSLIAVNRALKASSYDAVTALKRRSNYLSKKRQTLLDEQPDDPSTPYFDKLGITRLFVDEAHNYKNLPIDTNANYIRGISGGESNKCRDMLDKVRVVQKQNGGKGVCMATGTPITNSITDIYVMQLYLQSGELNMLDLQNFDSWANMFAETSTDFEIDVDTNRYRLATRFSKFHNLPELTSLLSMIADFHQVDGDEDIPQTDGRHDCMVARSYELTKYLQQISQRAENVRSGKVDKKDDNMLKITVDGRKAALDYRLVDPAAPFTYQSKVACCAANVWKIYLRTREEQSAQLVFCDSSTPKDGFNMYDELKRLLVSYGMPAEKIAFIHDSTTDARRSELFKKVNKGEVSVLIGSTFKLGLGVNVQERLIAIHHLDVPWRPADMTQREGRILRQGNTNSAVGIYRYITEGSFDAYSWQILETKARFICDLLSGALTERSGSDVENAVLNYAEVKALAIGDPLIKERVETANELARLSVLQRKTAEADIQLQEELTEIPARIKQAERLVDECRDDVEFYVELKSNATANKPIATPEEREAAIERRRVYREQLQNALSANVFAPTERTFQRKYHGFNVVLPANMPPERPYIYLAREGKYSVDMSGKVTMKRMDVVLEGLPERLEKLKDNVKKLKQRKKDIEAQLAAKEGYADDIERCKKKLEHIDKLLKVDKK